MKSKWKTIKIEDICSSICSGGTPKSNIKEYYSGDIPWLNTKEVNFNRIKATEKKISELGMQNSSAKWVGKNSIIVAMYGATAGKTAITKIPLTTNQACCNLTINEEKADYQFVYYALFNAYKELLSMANGGAQQNINARQIRDFKINLPDLPEQIKIANILSKLDEKIDLNNKINRNLYDQIKELTDAWMNDFLPFGGKKPYNWHKISLSKIATFTSGYSYKGNELKNSTIAMATIKNFDRNGGFKLDGFKEIIPSSKLKPTQHAQLFDTLVAHTDLTQNAEVIGNAELLLSLSGYSDIVYSMDVVKVTPKIQNISKFIIAAILNSKRFKSHCLGYINGTTVLHLSKKALPEYQFDFPDNPDDLKVLVTILEKMYQQIANNIQETEDLTSIRDILIPKLMSGQLDVSECVI